MARIYTGIGSRETPKSVLLLMGRMAARMSSMGWVLRSGGADGADTAFEESHNGKKEIYLPWVGFNGNESELYGVCEEALRLAASIHPAWDNCSNGAKLLHARNCYQILGKDLKTPSEMVICWTKDAKVVGGTATAISLAKKHHIPVYNLAEHGTYAALVKWVPPQYRTVNL